MSRNRSAGIVIRGDHVLVMHRINNGDEYWVFPGGGQEDGETPDQTAVREIDEETTIQVVPGELLYHITWDTKEENFFYLCEYVSGEPQLREDSNEFKQMQKENQVYEPMWIEIEKLPEIKLYQLEVRDLFLYDHKHGFQNETQRLFIKLEERRRI
jgi:mutator protein MutT